MRCDHYDQTVDLLGPGYQVIQSAARERPFDQPVNGVWASDHFGVTADLAVPRARPDPT